VLIRDPPIGDFFQKTESDLMPTALTGVRRPQSPWSDIDAAPRNRP
jgi:hypothetical protein